MLIFNTIYVFEAYNITGSVYYLINLNISWRCYLMAALKIAQELLNII